MMQKFVKSSDAPLLTSLQTFMFGGTTIRSEIVDDSKICAEHIYGMIERMYLSG